MADSDGGLIDFVAGVVGEGPLRVEESLGNGFVRLRVSEAERRQAKHDIRCVEDAVIELLRNARDAGARTVYLATTREASRRTLVCIDDGDGIPAEMRDRVFEARVTSKLNTMCMDRWGVHGRGMALFSIKQNAESAEVLASAPGQGSSIRVVIDCGTLPERADQSTWPRMGTDEDGMPTAVRGPHNIVRTAVEFAVDARRGTTVYLGTPTEILTALVARGEQASQMQGLVSPDDPDVALWQRPAMASDARSLMAYAAELGLDVSERTCYRILNGELPCPVSVLRTAVPARRPPAEIDLLKDRRGLKVARCDLEDFSQSLEQAFQTLGERYYLELKGAPRIQVSRDAVSVTFSIEKEC